MAEAIPLNNLADDVNNSSSDDEPSLLVKEGKSSAVLDMPDETDGYTKRSEFIKDRFKVYGDVALFASGSNNTHSTRELVPTDAYGQIEFLKASRKTRAEYIRLADTSNVDSIVQLFKVYWDLKPPKMLISIVGGHNDFAMSSEIQNSLRYGLRKIAVTAKPWIITGGIDSGIIKFVGDILQGHKYSDTVLMGVANWCTIRGRQSLKGTSNKDSTPTQYPPVHPIDEEYATEERKNELELNKDHSHFLLVDIPDCNTKPSRKIEFCAKLESRLINEQHSTFKRTISGARLLSTDEKFAPAIQIVVNGGPDAIRHVSLNLEMNTMHIVIIQGSGGAADLLAYACKLYDEHRNSLDANDEYLLTNKIQRTFPEKTELAPAIFGQVLKCAQMKQSITIFDPNGKLTLDEAILIGIMDRHDFGEDLTAPLVVDKHFFARLELAMAWNRADIAKAKIFKGVGFSSHPTELENLMCKALAENKVAMVELLLDSGFDIKSLDYDRLSQLYYKRFEPEDSLLRHFVDETRFERFLNKLEKDQKAIISDRIARERDTNKSTIRQRKRRDFTWAEQPKYIPLGFIHKDIIHLCGIDLSPKEKYGPLQKLLNPFNELFLWAVLCNMHDMALLFWKRGDEILARALIARKMYISMRRVYGKKFTILDEEIIQQLENNADEFGNLALGVLNECTCADKEAAKELLTEPLQNKNNQSCWQLAASSSFEEFVAHPVCQGMVMKRWCGNLEFQGSFYSFQVIMAILFFPLIFSFRYPDAHKKKKRSCFPKMKDKICMFYSAPITKFWLNVISYVLFLMLFIFVMQCKFKSQPSFPEWVLVSIMISLATEEIRQIVQGSGISKCQKIKSWWGQTWNKMDFVAILLFFIGFGFRMSQTDQLLEIGRVLYALDLMVLIIRLLDYFSVNKKLGPYVVMIKKMTDDVLYFVVIFFIFWLAYGISRSIILEADHAFTFRDLRQFIIPYFQMYGEMYVDPLETDENMTMFGTKKHNSYNEGIVAVMMVIYVLLTNLLLVNLLIALFNNTYALVQINSNRVWKWQWYCLVEEYIERPILVPPFIIISHLAQFIVYMWGCVSCRKRWHKIEECFCHGRRKLEKKRRHQEQTDSFRNQLADKKIENERKYQRLYLID